MNDIKVLYIRVNQYCNAHCFMCDFWKNKKVEIKEEQFEDILNKMNDIEMVRFTGGEPLLCQKLPRYIEMCHLRGIKTSVITNGIILDKKLNELVEKGLNQIIVSVDGSSSELHNSLRGTKGLWEKIDVTLKRISKDYPSLHTRVNTVVSKKNFSDLANMAKWLDECKVEQWSIIPIKMNNYKWCDKLSLEDFTKKYADFQKSIEACKVQLMGYSASWAGNVEDFWKGKWCIRPKGKCYVTQMLAFFDPFINHLYPCNCIPHRKESFNNEQEEKGWYFEHGHEHCCGCDPLNAYCSDFPDKVVENIFNI